MLSMALMVKPFRPDEDMKIETCRRFKKKVSVAFCLRISALCCNKHIFLKNNESAVTIFFLNIRMPEYKMWLKLISLDKL
jgi:hypothetical protein